MKNKFVEFICAKFPSLVIFVNYYNDYKKYAKYNFGNKKAKSFNAIQAKILRQTHIIEKGLSLSSPRKGFGTEKINTLLAYLDQYLELQFPMEDITFKNAINVLERYTEFQKKLGYSNDVLNAELEKYRNVLDPAYSCGITEVNKEELLNKNKGDFKELFLNRHSVRQFSDMPVDYEKVRAAVKLAMKAPSACNRQTAKVYFIRDKEKNKKIGKIIPGNTGFESEVQNYLIVTSTRAGYTTAAERNQMYVDGALFAMSLILSLEYYGIASCALQGSESKRVVEPIKRLAEISDEEVIVLYIAIGNFKDNFQVAVSKRKELSDVLSEI